MKLGKAHGGQGSSRPTQHALALVMTAPQEKLEKAQSLAARSHESQQERLEA